MVRNFTTPRSLMDSANNDDRDPNARGIGGAGVQQGVEIARHFVCLSRIGRWPLRS